MSELNFISHTQVIHYLLMSCNPLMRQNLLVHHPQTYLTCKNSMFFFPQFVLHRNMHMDFLKVFFLSLKGMGEHMDIQTIYKAIEAMLVLHNICIDQDELPPALRSLWYWLSWTHQDLCRNTSTAVMRNLMLFSLPCVVPLSHHHLTMLL